MTAKARATSALKEAAALRDRGAYDAARTRLEALAAHPDAHALGEPTALGMPRQLHAAFLRLAKAEGDALRRIGYQFHLVPPPQRMAPWATLDPARRHALAKAGRLPVPRVIHQIWIGALDVPATANAWAVHARARGYAYRLWREADLEALGATAGPAYREMYGRGDLPGAVDAARYAILAAEGGIYLDCDWYPARDDITFHDRLPLTGLCAMAEAVPRDTGAGGLMLANSFLAAPPRHPVFIRLTEVLPAILAEMPRAPAWWATGPLIFSRLARLGPVTLADAGLVAAELPRNAPSSQIDAVRARAPAEDLGLLIGWKSW
jgi:inositol phosphorylceramide mannosyltransferase catalytic subunit